MSGQVEVKYWRAPSNVFNAVLDRQQDRGLFATVSFDLVSSGVKQGLHSLLLNHSSRLEKTN